MATMTRTDVHAPRNLRTEDYEFAYAYDAHPEEGDRGAQARLLNLLIADGWRFGQVHGGDTCDHCGTPLRYVAVMKHFPSHTLIKVGETCLENRFALASSEFHRLRKAAKLHRERNTRAERTEQFLAVEEHAAAVAWLREESPKAMERWDGFGDDPFVCRILASFERDGELTERQVDAVLASMKRQSERAAARAERDERLPDPAPVVAGKVQVEGEVLSIKWQDNAYGGRLVMTVCDDRGFRVWGSVPSSIERRMDEIAAERRGEGTLGDTSYGLAAALLKPSPDGVQPPPLRVKFTASLEASEKDETFGFFKRPTRAEVIA